jgi:hypothetical protein
LVVDEGFSAPVGSAVRQSNTCRTPTTAGQQATISAGFDT